MEKKYATCNSRVACATLTVYFICINIFHRKRSSGMGENLNVKLIKYYANITKSRLHANIGKLLPCYSPIRSPNPNPYPNPDPKT